MATGTFTWTTDVPASSQVEYGTTTAYGTLTPYDPARVTSHTVVVTGLSPGVTYHWRARSRDVAGTETLSADQTITTIAASAYQTAIQADAPIGYWRLGESSGTVAADSSGNGNNGTYTGGVTLGTTGALASDTDAAVILNGSTGTITVPHATAFNLTGSLTLECWVFPTDRTTYEMLITKDSGSGSVNNTFELRLEQTTGIPNFLQNVSPFQSVLATTAPPLGQWSHLAVTKSGTTVTHYLNGVANGSGTIAGTVTTNTQPVRFGSRDDVVTAQFLNGRLDEVAIYATALTATRLLAHVTAAGGTTASPPVISAVIGNALSPTSAVVTWTTDVPATSQIDYGLTNTYGETSPPAPALVTSHLVTVTDLGPNALYHYRARSAGSTGVLALSADQTLQTPDLPFGTPDDFVVTSIGPAQVSVSWTTSIAADSQVDYGLSTDYGLQTALDPTPVTVHQATITGLFPNTTYHLRARSHDPTSTLLLSDDLTITTPLPASRIYTWIEPNGTGHVLDPSGDPNIRVIQGARGGGLAPTQWLEDRVPQHDGTLVRDVLYDAREIEVPLLVQTDDYPSLLGKTRAMRRWMNVKNGDGTLQVADPDGTIRQFTCRLKQGLEGQEGQDVSGPNWRKLLLVFRTSGSDPYAQWPYTLSQTFQQSAAAQVWFPFFPVLLGGAGIFALPTVNNPGDVDAEPIWTITGPATNPIITNTATGAKISLTTALLGGQSLVIDTRFRKKSIVRNDGTKLFSALSNDSALWTLPPGSTAVSIQASGTTPGVSQVQLSFTPRTL